MTQRETLARQFLTSAGWDTAERALLAGDASNRRYDRLRDRENGTTAILMDAPPDKGEDVRPFVSITNHLRALGFSAPRILAQDPTHGFLLLEDLGDNLYARAIPRNPGLEDLLYETATDVLVALHQTPAPVLAPYDAPLMSELGALPFDWYLEAPDLDAKVEFQSLLQDLLTTHCQAQPVLIQRDYHAENLLWLSDRTSLARVGLLDYQDAMAGHPAYDLVSLLEDARRDVPPALQTRMLDRYIGATGTDPERFRLAYACLGAQRNLRILGVFARLCKRDGKAHYVDFIPRVWGYLMQDVAAPEFEPLRKMIIRHLPAPQPNVLERIKRQCAKTQMP